MRDWLREILEEAAEGRKQIANHIWPNGTTLVCRTCGYTEYASAEDCARYFGTHWPIHCGRQMVVDTERGGR
jgi:hypothetical protein